MAPTEMEHTKYTEHTKHSEYPWKKIVYYILGIIEVLLAFRLIFKLLGANPASSFVSGIYTLTNIFLSPFTGIFPTATARGIETQSVLEPATIVAMIVYALIAWGIVKLIEIIKHNHKV